MPPIVKLVQLHVAEGRRQELLELLEPVRAAAAEDPGTEAWAVHADRSRPDQIFIYERYRDHAAAEIHEALPVLREAIAGIGACLARPPSVIDADLLFAAE